MKIQIVDENDNLIKCMERKESDKNPGLIYRVSYLWITDTDGKILLAQRSFNKNHNPGKWGPAVAGTIDEGETYESNIIKEAEEEIGLKDIKPILGKKTREKTNWNYFSQEFLLTLPSGFNNFRIQEDEVEQLRWFSKDELKEELISNPNIFLSLIHKKLK